MITSKHNLADQSITIRAESANNCLLCGEEGVLYAHNIPGRVYGSLEAIYSRSEKNVGAWSFFECKKCRLLWLNPRPVKDDLWKAYAEYPFHTAPTYRRSNLKTKLAHAILHLHWGYSSLTFQGSKIFTAFLQIIRFLPFYDFLVNRAGHYVMYLSYVPGGKLLDVGCGNGLFMEKMKEFGWNVYGIDIDRESVEVARKHFDLENVYCDDGTKQIFPASFFNAVTLHHTLEHLVSPSDTIKECYRILKEGGTLSIITPHAYGLPHVLFGKRGTALDVPRHTFLFSPDSLRTLLILSGFAAHNIKIFTSCARAYANYFDILRSFNIPKILTMPLAALLFVLEYLLLKLKKDAGTELVALATK